MRFEVACGGAMKLAVFWTMAVSRCRIFRASGKYWSTQTESVHIICSKICFRYSYQYVLLTLQAVEGNIFELFLHVTRRFRNCFYGMVQLVNNFILYFEVCFPRHCVCRSVCKLFRMQFKYWHITLSCFEGLTIFLNYAFEFLKCGTASSKPVM